MSSLFDPPGLLAWMDAHRGLTIRTVEAFPEDKLFAFAGAEPMRPFAEMVKEMITIEDGYVQGIVNDNWEWPVLVPNPTTKAGLLDALHAVRERTRQLWGGLTVDRLQHVMQDPWFGTEQPHLDRILYLVENEIHHRGQGYVYLRQLGIEPPPFYER